MNKKLAQTKISPITFFICIAAVLAFVLYFGFRTALAPPVSVKGINPDGSVMTDEQAAKLADAMSGGRYSKNKQAALQNQQKQDQEKKK